MRMISRCYPKGLDACMSTARVLERTRECATSVASLGISSQSAPKRMSSTMTTSTTQATSTSTVPRMTTAPSTRTRLSDDQGRVVTTIRSRSHERWLLMQATSTRVLSTPLQAQAARKKMMDGARTRGASTRTLTG